MGFKTGNFPPVDPATFLDEPLKERVRKLAIHWVEYGFGSPKRFHTTFLAKVLVVHLLLGFFLATYTSGTGPVWDVAAWWNEPIVYQKMIVWTMLLEVLGIAGSWGPLAGKFKPSTGGVLFWTRPGTLRMRPWNLPGTGGDTRTLLDVALYLTFIGLLAATVLSSGRESGGLQQALPDSSGLLLSPTLCLLIVATAVLIGLRDKVVFLAARSEQYLPALVFFSLLGFVDMIVALKLLMVVVWMGAGFSKFGHHFTNVVAPMVSNSPTTPTTWLRRAHYRDFPNDLRPSRLASFMAHVGGTAVEMITPLVLLFSTDRTVTLVAVAIMVVFHLFIASTFPIAVPLEWNTMFAFGAIALFAGFPAQDGFAVFDMSSPLLTATVVAGLLFFPVLGNVRPDLVSFLPSMRQYAGNWATAMWAFKPGAEAKLNAVTRPTTNQIDQLQALGYPYELAEITMQQTIAWRAMHSQGRGLFSIFHRYLPDVDNWTIREGEFACNSLLGFNFGDGHFHNHKLIAALQRRCNFEPGEFIVAWVESEAFGSGVQHYQVIDAALGIVERGTWKVTDAVAEQPWLPNGPIPLNVTWRDPNWSVSAPGPRWQPTLAHSEAGEPAGDKVGA